ncbi:hypothetical protein AM412_000084 [Acinetobacter baumannii]|nr:hypothetical protein AM412_000084 [Acinetobacter baumannii]OKO43402.1 hypothetical protein AM416_000087 [Acinetobacter baumannii]SLM57821.1 Uncharacterised protein [Acinetobacter baumannii]SMB69275.1 Uncharacterised protein [Acinetobacter baumannii]
MHIGLNKSVIKAGDALCLNNKVVNLWFNKINELKILYHSIFTLKS